MAEFFPLHFPRLENSTGGRGLEGATIHVSGYVRADTGFQDGEGNFPKKNYKQKKNKKNLYAKNSPFGA